MTDLYLILITCTIAILLAVWYCTHQILSGQKELAANIERFRHVLKIYVDYVDLERWKKSEEGMRAVSRSRL